MHMGHIIDVYNGIKRCRLNFMKPSVGIIQTHEAVKG